MESAQLLGERLAFGLASRHEVGERGLQRPGDQRPAFLGRHYRLGVAREHARLREQPLDAERRRQPEPVREARARPPRVLASLGEIDRAGFRRHRRPPA